MNHLQWYLINEFVEDYKEGYLSRREMMRRVIHITGGVASAAAILTALGCGTSKSNTSPAVTIGVSAGSPRATSAGVATTLSGTPALGTGSPAARATPAASPRATPSASPAGSPVAGGPRSPLSVPANDPAVATRDITFPGQGTTLMAYEARPSAGSGPFPVVLVCHENMGLTDHIRDVTRRFAREGYLACAVDLLSRQGGTNAVSDKSTIPGILSRADPNQHVADFKSAADYYAGQSSLAQPDRIGMNGFCFGGGIVWMAVEGIPTLRAAVPYYGPPPPLEKVPQIKAAVFAVYSSDPNDFANSGRDQLVAALTSAGVRFGYKVYPGTMHAFNNDTGRSWNEAQSLAAWQDTLAWFGKYLRA